MKRFKCIILIVLMVFPAFAATRAESPAKKKLPPVTIRDASNEPIELPYLGEKVLMIFYVDPDHANQNKEFRENLEKNQIDSENIYGFGVVNLKDAPMLPNAIVRAMVRKNSNRTGAAIYTDPGYLLRDAWDLGDCNDKFVLMIVNKERELEFISKGEMNQQQIDEFYRVIDKYK